ncbi:hypothetical protein [Microbulbifer sp. GL-2]|uniref:hypothetical protein n=1 Tax=Microbulbifer sp. GL-2 TaxID=2591606 RepID=UPI001162448C|nr:hypothetical protein [Microbulbifer sp. GL-2]BBM02952.1 hypothetical protein GL2_30260 [Microbulbifer sp. GL-2]
MDEIYHPPASELETKKKSVSPLYKISGIGVATFVGSILAGGVLMYLNYKRLGLYDKATKCIVISIVATIAIFGVVYLIPEDINIPNIAFTIPQVIAMVQIAKSQQEALINEHISSGGTMSSNWKAFGISVLIILAIIALVTGAVFVTTTA